MNFPVNFFRNTMGISNNNIKKKSRYGVSIIVTSYNTKVLLKNCIDSVIKNTRGIDYEIIIVDNDSTDGTRDYLSTLQKNKRVKVVLNKKNLGFGRGNNIGIEKSQIKPTTDEKLIIIPIKKFELTRCSI